MAFQFPNPQTTPEFTADNGITYRWDVDDSKWQVKTTAALDDIRQDIIELEEEIDAIAPSVERGKWTFTAVGTVANPGQFTMYDDEFGSGQPTGLFKSAKSIWFNEIDSEGTSHAFGDVDDGELLEIFVDGSPEYGLYEVVGQAHDETQGASSFWVVDVNFVRTNEVTTAVGPGELCRFKIFMAPAGGDASEILKYVDDRLEGVVGRYILKDVANNPVSASGHMGISTSFYPNVNQFSFGAKDLDGGVTKQLTDGDIIETFDVANNKNNRFRVTDASKAPSVVKVEFVSGNSGYSIDNVYQVQIYPGGDFVKKTGDTMSGKLQLDKARGDNDNGDGFTVKGAIADGYSSSTIVDQTGNLLQVNHIARNPDEINYLGRIKTDKNITTKEYVDDKIAVLLAKIEELEMAEAGAGALTNYSFRMLTDRFYSSSGMGNSMPWSSITSSSISPDSSAGIRWTGESTSAIAQRDRYIYVCFPDDTYQLNPQGGFTAVVSQSGSLIASETKVFSFLISGVEKCPEEYANNRNIWRAESIPTEPKSGINQNLTSFQNGNNLFVTFNGGSVSKTSA